MFVCLWLRINALTLHSIKFRFPLSRVKNWPNWRTIRQNDIKEVLGRFDLRIQFSWTPEYKKVESNLVMKCQNRWDYEASLFSSYDATTHRLLSLCNLLRKKASISQKLEGRKTWILWFAKLYEMAILIMFCTNQKKKLLPSHGLHKLLINSDNENLTLFYNKQASLQLRACKWVGQKGSRWSQSLN
jgi:hypothetical protein